VSVASGVRLNEAFSGVGCGQYAPPVFATLAPKNALDKLVFLRSAACVSVSTPTVLYVRANCASLISIFFALYEYAIIVLVRISDKVAPHVRGNVMCTPFGVLIGYRDWRTTRASLRKLLTVMGTAKSYPPVPESRSIADPQERIEYAALPHDLGQSQHDARHQHW